VRNLFETKPTAYDLIHKMKRMSLRWQQRTSCYKKQSPL